MKKKSDLSELILLMSMILLLLLFGYVKRGMDQEEALRKQTVISKEQKNLVADEAFAQKISTENEIIRDSKDAESDEKEPDTEAQTTGIQSITETAESTARIRVLIKTNQFESYYHKQVILSGNTTLHLNDTIYEAKSGETLTIESDSEWFCEDQIHVEPTDQEAGTAVLSLERASGTPVYEGTLDIYRTENGMILVNELDLETYLRYVVPSEMPASYEEEALKAQAVCARTYAWKQILEEDLSKYHAHVDDSVSYQVYHNLDPKPSTDEAVKATEGEIMTCDGEPITAYFFSTSCGFTSTDEVWNGKAGESFLKSVYVGDGDEEQDQADKTEEAFASFIKSKDENNLEVEDAWYRWNVTLPSDVIRERLLDQTIGEITGMSIQKRSDGGAVEQLRITGTNGTTVIENEYQIRQLLSVKGYAVAKNDGNVTKEMNLLPSAYFLVTPVEKDGKISAFTFWGGGYGHGVGMSQNGANHLAAQGYSYREILSYFYQNIELTKWNDACSG
ncbi:MAG: SpoIID/LytB domain-containing protein [Fusicatenibacter sp.]|nr:SpoIID/LytB domain-containing protein [Fusicatenibacter sp.]